MKRPPKPLLTAAETEFFEELLRQEKRGGTLDMAQIELVGEVLRRAKPSEDIYAVARLFAAYYPPTPENVRLLERFMQDDADDQSRKGAVIGASYSWQLAGIDLDLITKIASPTYLIKDNASMWFALSALGSAAVASRAARRKLLEVAAIAENAKFEANSSRSLYMRALREALHTATVGHEAIRIHTLYPEKLPKLADSVRLLKTKLRA